MSAPRRCARSASDRSSIRPAAHSAVSSPKLCPPDQVGPHAEVLEDPQQSQADRADRRLGEPRVAQGQLLLPRARRRRRPSGDRSGPRADLAWSPRDLVQPERAPLHARETGRPARAACRRTATLARGRASRAARAAARSRRRPRAVAGAAAGRGCRPARRAGSRQRFQPRSGRGDRRSTSRSSPRSTTSSSR